MHKTIDFSSPLQKAETVMKSKLEEFKFNILWRNVEFLLLLGIITRELFEIENLMILFMPKLRGSIPRSTNFVST